MPLFATDRDSQLGHFEDVDRRHYRWQTDGGYFSQTERELLAAAELPADGRLLEIGCGEGGNLYHLGTRPGWVGLDFAHRKLVHAHSEMPALSFACGDAAALPFRDASFDAVLIRDVLHHVPQRQAVVAEAARVVAPGGAVAVIEPNRNNPLIVAQAIAVKAERAVLRSTASRLRGELQAAGFDEVRVRRAQPLPLARALLHPRLGMARYGHRPGVARWLRAADTLARRLVHPAAWMYLVGRGRKPRG
jgi:demethylmenaquinone methyltransferase/2-methoxy-6-polyprenyl-1,4-benzoquinol methylase